MRTPAAFFVVSCSVGTSVVCGPATDQEPAADEAGSRSTEVKDALYRY